MHGFAIKTATVFAVDHNHHLLCAKTINIVLIGNDVAPDNLILIDPNASEVASEDESEVDSSLEAFVWQFYVFMS